MTSAANAAAATATGRTLENKGLEATSESRSDLRSVSPPSDAKSLVSIVISLNMNSKPGPTPKTRKAALAKK